MSHELDHDASTPVDADPGAVYVADSPAAGERMISDPIADNRSYDNASNRLRQLYHDFGREVAWELEQGRLDSPYLMGVLARVRANDGFTQNEEWPDV
jgi:hypothetical protein